MLISVPMAYFVAYKLPKSRSIEREYFSDWVDVEIDEVSERDAPLATRWTVAPGETTSDGFHETRWHNGFHYYRLEAAERGEAAAHLDADGFVDAITAGKLRDGMVLTEDRRPLIESVVAGKIPRIESISDSRILGSDFDEQLEITRRRCANFLIVDGKAWVRGPEPVLDVVIGAELGFDAALIWVTHRGRPTPPSPSSNTFRADRLDDAIDHATAYGYERHRVAAPRFEVLFSESILFKDEAKALLSNAEKILEASKDDVLNFTKPAISAWVDVRDAFVAAEDNPDDANLAALAESLREFGSFDTEDSNNAILLANTIKRWDLRPMEVEASLEEEDISAGMQP